MTKAIYIIFEYILERSGDCKFGIQISQSRKVIPEVHEDFLKLIF